MASAFVSLPDFTISSALAIGSHERGPLAPGVAWLEAGHPLPDARSVAAGRRVLEVAGRVAPGEHLVLLLSGGASALMSAPLDGIALDDKQRVIETMMHAGADIHALNTVRKHMSAIKGGRLAASCRGATWTFAVSDVVGDDISVIGSGPGVPDPTTWADGWAALERFGGRDHPVTPVVSLFERGLAGEIPDTPKPGAPALAHAHARVIGGRRDALDGARMAAEARGYRTIVLDEPVTGEARVSAVEWLDRVLALAAGSEGPTCVLSAGETTVRVTGGGKGGRNQEFALALVDRIGRVSGAPAVASVGTDGVDGPTDAAGALVDTTSQARAREGGLAASERFLGDNDSFTFFETLGDLIRTGPTDTNVGDLQAFLAG